MARALDFKDVDGKDIAVFRDTGIWLMDGEANTRAGVRADGGDDAPIGSVYFSNDGGGALAPKVYFKIANAGANTDWERLVTATAD